jgi:hypothetical protein
MQMCHSAQCGEESRRERQRMIRLAGAILEEPSYICAFFHNLDEQYQVLLPNPWWSRLAASPCICRPSIVCRSEGEGSTRRHGGLWSRFVSCVVVMPTTNSCPGTDA